MKVESVQVWRNRYAHRRMSAMVPPVPGEFRICRHSHPRVQNELSQSFDFLIFKRGNSIQSELFKGKRVLSDTLSHCSVLFACLTLTTAELHAAIGV